ncbi:ribonuclease H-like domain-containing protein [Tanacetum coccineum]
MAVIWNPSVRKSLGIVIPVPKAENIVVGFGVCPDTSDPKLVKISDAKIPSVWEVDVFSLCTRVWKTVYTGAPFKLGDLSWFQVFVNGVIYFHAYDSIYLDDGVRSNLVISFDLKSEKFGEVCLPERLVHAPHLKKTKSTPLSDSVYGSTRKSTAKLIESVQTPSYEFHSTQLHPNVNLVCCNMDEVEGKWLYNSVLGFRNNGEVVMELDADNYKESRIEVYEPLSRHFDGVGINGKRLSFSARSYMETLLLLNESDSIIH